MGKHVKIAVIGAGASGMMAAIAAAGRGAEVTLSWLPGTVSAI